MMGMGQGMMGNMMGGMGGTGSMSGMSGTGSMSNMSGMSSGSLLDSIFSLLFNGLLILAVIALFVGLIGFGYTYIKKNFFIKSETKVEAKTEAPEIIEHA